MSAIVANQLDGELKTPIIVTTYLKGDDTVEHVLLKGGQHPRMMFVPDAAHCKSYSSTFAFDSTDPEIDLYKGAGRIEVAVTAGGSGAAGFKEAFTRTAAAAGKIERNTLIFEPQDDVVVQISAAGNAATFNFVQLYFDRIN